MPDIKRHTPYIWRSFCFDRISFTVLEWMKEFFEKNNILYSFQNYGDIGDEEAHISYRIAFNDEKELKKFKRYMKRQEGSLRIIEKGYDESPDVKMAYVLGTRLYEDYKELTKGIGGCHSYEFFLLMLHGFFNDYGYVYEDEIKIYNYFIQRLLTMVF